MSIVLNSSGGGSITLNEPATASNFTQTLPAATGDVMVSGNMPAFSAYATTTQTITVATYTKVNFDTEEYDTNSNFASSRFTPTVAGYYQLNAAVLEYGSGVPTRASCVIYKNGSAYKLGQDFQIGTTGYISSTTVNSLGYANGTTDYFEIYVSIATVGTPQIFGRSDVTYFNGSLVRVA